MDHSEARLLNVIQSDFPVTPRPYKDLGAALDFSEKEIIEGMRRLREKGYIRRIGGKFDSGKMGFVSTLCAAKVPEDRIDSFVKVVNAYPEVTHNYLRDNYYNIWFTFVASKNKLIQRYIGEIIEKTGIIEIINLPAVKRFKVFVNFEFD